MLLRIELRDWRALTIHPLLDFTFTAIRHKTLTALVKGKLVLLAKPYEILQDVMPDDFPADSVIFFIAYGNATGFHDIRSTCPLIVGGVESELNTK
jgi:hypothetical protein